MKNKDVVLEINGQPMASVTQLRSQIAMMRPGTVAKIKVLRGGEERMLEIAIGHKEAAIAQRGRGFHDDLFGMKLRDLTARQARRFGHDGPALLVVGVEKGSIAEEAGIEPFDIILKVGGEDVTTVVGFRQEAAKLDIKDGIPLVIMDDEGKHGVDLKE